MRKLKCMYCLDATSKKTSNNYPFNLFGVKNRLMELKWFLMNGFDEEVKACKRHIHIEEENIKQFKKELELAK